MYVCSTCHSLDHFLYLDHGLCSPRVLDCACVVANGVCVGRTVYVRCVQTEFWLTVHVASNAMPFVCSVPLLVASSDQIGTGYGLYKAVGTPTG
jgi:hypothetical protein